MEINEHIDFLKTNFFLILILTIILTPIIWSISSMYYSGRIETYKVKIELHESKIKDLESANSELEAKKNSFKNIIKPASFEVDLASRIYSPSNTINK